MRLKWNLSLALGLILLSHLAMAQSAFKPADMSKATSALRTACDNSRHDMTQMVYQQHASPLSQQLNFLLSVLTPSEKSFLENYNVNLEKDVEVRSTETLAKLKPLMESWKERVASKGIQTEIEKTGYSVQWWNVEPKNPNARPMGGKPAVKIVKAVQDMLVARISLRYDADITKPTNGFSKELSFECDRGDLCTSPLSTIEMSDFIEQQMPLVCQTLKMEDLREQFTKQTGFPLECKDTVMSCQKGIKALISVAQDIKLLKTVAPILLHTDNQVSEISLSTNPNQYRTSTSNAQYFAHPNTNKRLKLKIEQINRGDIY
ncbi:MAG: hypothetical protein AB7F59_02500 [Bdellovibrionales bacterium]